MKPSELLKREPESIVNIFADRDNSKWLFMDYFQGTYFNHVPELNINPHDIDGFVDVDFVTVKVLKDFNFDSRRYWRICVVCLHDFPVMIIQNAGREGDDYYDRFIVDPDRYKELVRLISSLIRVDIEPENLQDVVSLDEDIPSLTEFYGNELDGYFKRYW